MKKKQIQSAIIAYLKGIPDWNITAGKKVVKVGTKWVHVFHLFNPGGPAQEPIEDFYDTHVKTWAEAIYFA